MNAFTATIIMQTEDRIDNVLWQKCISDAIERYRDQSGQKLVSVSFTVRGENK